MYGVELFFILSGFLIGSILIREVAETGAGLQSVRHFLVRRWYRTLPNYYAYLLLTVIVAAPWKNPIHDLEMYPFFLQNFAWSMKPFFIVSWSLSVEEWFYFSFPVVIFCLAKSIKQPKKLIKTAVIIFLIAPLLLRAATTTTKDWHAGVHMVVIYRLDAIGIGVLLAYFRYYCGNLWKLLCSTGAMLIGLGSTILIFFCMLYAGYGEGKEASFPGIQNAIFFDLLDFTCALMLPWFSTVSTIREPGNFLFTWISILSYSLYLSHGPMVKVTGALFSKIGLTHVSPILFTAAWLIAAVFVSLCSYFFIERTFLRLRDKRPG